MDKQVLKNKAGNKNLIVHVDINLHSEIKARAARFSISIKSYVIEAILDKMSREDEYR